jgi:hypothetical protein
MMRGKRLWIWVALAAGFAGCGDDKESASRSETVTSAVPKAAFCAALAKIEAPLAEAGQYATREQKIEAAKTVASRLDVAAKIAPSDIADAAKTRLDSIRATAEGEPSKLIDSPTLEATEKLKTYCPPA